MGKEVARWEHGGNKLGVRGLVGGGEDWTGVSPGFRR